VVSICTHANDPRGLHAGSMNWFFGLMLWSGVALPVLGLALSVVVGILITPIELSRLARRIVVSAGALLVLMCLPGLLLLLSML
jgi:hypothetical protein